MKKFLKITGITLLLLVVVYLILCLTAPPLKVERSIVINASDSLIFSKYGNFKNWDSWSPWSKKDPGIPANSVYTGTPFTVGHQVEWKSKKEGSGRQVIEEIKPYSVIKTALYFQPNDNNPGHSEFTITPEGSGNKVTWKMQGEMPFMFKGMTVIFGMNKSLGKYFEDGLKSIKDECEKK